MKRMIRNNALAAVAAGLASALLAGCVQGLESQQMLSGKSEHITFTAGSESITTKAGANVTYANCLTITEEEWPVEAATKGNPTTAFSGNASVTGFVYDGAWSSSLTPWDLMYDKTFKFSGTALTAESNPIPWVKAAEKEHLTVYAYAPEDFPGTLSASDVAGVPTINYTVPSSVANQKDLIVASATVDGDLGSSIPLNFTHALAAVKFNVDFPCTVKSIVVNGVYSHGVFSLDGSWSGVTTDANYTIDLGAGLDCLEGSSVTDGDNTLMLIPQTVPAGATVVMTYTEDGVTDKTLTVDIAGNVWPAGKRITYALSKSDPTYIYFDLNAGSVSITGSGSNYIYRGYVYKNNGAAIATVTGTHSADNKYYVYQSSTDPTSTGYYPNTGYAGEPGIGPVRVPEYPELRSPDGTKTWSEYVTNNTDSGTIIDLMGFSDLVNYDASAHPLVAQAKRSGTRNNIYVCATSAAGTLTADITVDNIWSTRFSNSNAWTDLPLSFIGNNAAHFGIDFRLKGDNFCTRICFGTERVDDYFRITSIEGDGSSAGSLTVAPLLKYPSDEISSSACSCITSPGRNGGYKCYGFAINGGTIYAATPLSLRRNISGGWTSNCIGAGTNGDIHMDINGGTITAVAHCTGAAIGGGAGSVYRGGDGYVNINGGRIYAYQFGVASDNSLLGIPVSSTAIGGGSTLRGVANSGYVTIGGNAYVYAQSVGGVAIGGGSSGGCTGGEANVTIGGNATVIAKSIPGIITQPFAPAEDHIVSAGTAIGGGNGGDENYKLVATSYGTPADAIATGGNAVVTISSGHVYTGSLGGGKNGVSATGEARTLGSAHINITGGDVQGQFIMVAGAATPPYFTMSGGVINNAGLQEADGFYKVKDNGGAVFIGTGSNPGSFTMNGGTIMNASAVNGGVVYQEDGSCTITGGTITRSSASGSGGAVYIAGEANPTFTMSGGEISRCSAASNGGAVYLEGGTVAISGGSIESNKSNGGSGGGIYINKGDFTMTDGDITGNFASVDGGGVYVSSVDTDVSATVSGGSITANSCEFYGGGLCVLPGGTSTALVTLGTDGGTLTNPEISENRSRIAGGGVYASGANANIIINSGRCRDNQVSAYVANEDMANEGGMVTLNDGDVLHQVVTFHANGGYFDSDPSVTQKVQNIVTSTNSTLVTPAVYERLGYHFAGWNTRADGWGTTYTDGQIMNITEDVDLYIQWELD